MEIITNKKNEDRAFVRVNFEKVRVLGSSNSKNVRKRRNRIGNIVIYDFENGPYFNVGGNFYFEKLKYKIQKIEELEAKDDVKEIVLTITPNY